MMSMTEISKEKFWDNVNAVLPLLRLGYSDGPGAFINSKRCDLRRCTVVGKMDYTYRVSLVLKNTEGKSQFFEHDEPMTINEFKAFCDRILPGVGVCEMRWGAELLDANGNLRSNLEYPVLRGLRLPPVRKGLRR
jgi:hypothetical protein